MSRVAAALGMEIGTLKRMSQQIRSMLTSYCDDTALAIVEGLEEHGELSGLEADRRIYSEQKGTLNQRTEDLRNRVLYPERVKAVTDVVQAVTKWDTAYSALLEACGGNMALRG